jgi:hypothetical protein
MWRPVLGKLAIATLVVLSIPVVLVLTLIVALAIVGGFFIHMKEQLARSEWIQRFARPEGSVSSARRSRPRPATLIALPISFSGWRTIPKPT